MEVTLGQQYNVGEKPTVILYNCINNAVSVRGDRRKELQLEVQRPSKMHQEYCEQFQS